MFSSLKTQKQTALAKWRSTSSQVCGEKQACPKPPISPWERRELLLSPGPCSTAMKKKNKTIQISLAAIYSQRSLQLVSSSLSPFQGVSSWTWHCSPHLQSSRRLWSSSGPAAMCCISLSGKAPKKILTPTIFLTDRLWHGKRNMLETRCQSSGTYFHPEERSRHWHQDTQLAGHGAQQCGRLQNWGTPQDANQSLHLKASRHHFQQEQLLTTGSSVWSPHQAGFSWSMWALFQPWEANGS